LPHWRRGFPEPAVHTRPVDIREGKGVVMSPKLQYQEAIEKAMADNGIRDPMEVLYGLFRALHDLHPMVTSGPNPGYNDCLDKVTGDHATNLSESLRNLTRVFAGVKQMNADGRRKGGDLQGAESLTFIATRMKTVADILDHLIPAWNFEGGEFREAIDRMNADRKRKQGEDPSAGESKPPTQGAP
jgi:hypothetical protein